MPRLATSSDVFNAVAEPARREIFALLTLGERPVNDLVDSLGLAQPQVSKHLRVLKDVGLVSARQVGRQRIYRAMPQKLKPMYDWVSTFERYWSHQLDRIKANAERKVEDPSPNLENSSEKHPEDRPEKPSCNSEP